MTLIASISGIRGTIGGSVGNNLTPIDIVKFSSAFGTWLSFKYPQKKVVIGRDARVSGEMVEKLVTAVMIGLGFEVINLGLTTTPTVEVAIPEFEAAGGVVITASHNPENWNALKLLNNKGEFITRKAGLEVLEILEEEYYRFRHIGKIGSVQSPGNFVQEHIEKILKLKLVDRYAVGKAKLKVVVDGVNSGGGIFVPQLLRSLGVEEIVELNCEPTGKFAHNPEPLRENLGEICSYIQANGADLGIVVDPDVDRLVLIDEKGEMFGEEYTIVAISDYVLSHTKSAVVSNLSSSRALKDVAEWHGCRHYSSAVGEVNVTEIMKRSDALIGGEGNGGVIYPELHYGRDALVGIALFLTQLVKHEGTASALRAKYPNYFMSKQKIKLKQGVDIDEILSNLKETHKDWKQNKMDGLRVDFEKSWVHLRKSNTEPIIRVYSEAPTQQEADNLASAHVRYCEAIAHGSGREEAEKELA